MDLGAGGWGSMAEPYVAEVRDGRLLMFGRNSLGRVFQSWSDSGGEEWTQPEPTGLAASCSPNCLTI